MNEIATAHSTGTSPFDSIKRTGDRGEYWLARDLMPLVGYAAWRNFEVPLNRAMKAAEVQGFVVAEHFAGSRKISETKPAADFALTRFAAYLVAMNGDPNKPEVAAAQAYFAIRTREAEVAPIAQLTGPELMARALIEAQSVIESKDARIAELEPRAAYVERFVADEDLRILRNVAKSIGVQEKTLRDALLDHDWIYKEESSRWSESRGEKETVTRYSARADKRNYFRPVPNHEAPRFRGEVMHTLKVTPAGAVAIERMARRWGLTADALQVVPA